MAWDRVYLKEIKIADDKSKATLVYSDGDSFDVSYEDYNRALMTLANGDKEAIRHDFALKA